MELVKLSKKELFKKCEELNITKYKTKTKLQLIDLIDKLLKKENIEELKIINRGTNAGGSNTNYYGKKFEEKTNNELTLMQNNYIKNNFNKKYTCLSKSFQNKTIVFTKQTAFKAYIKFKYNIELFRYPDEAYIIQYNTGKKIIKILEKRNKMCLVQLKQSYEHLLH